MKNTPGLPHQSVSALELRSFAARHPISALEGRALDLYLKSILDDLTETQLTRLAFITSVRLENQVREHQAKEELNRCLRNSERWEDFLALWNASDQREMYSVDELKELWGEYVSLTHPRDPFPEDSDFRLTEEDTIK